MTVASAPSSVTYQGNGAASTFPFRFLIQTTDDLQVVLTDTTVSPVAVTEVMAGQYGVAGIGTDDGTVTYPLTGAPLPAGMAITLRRQVPYQQQVRLTNQAFLPEVLEGAMDALALQTQQLAEGLARAVRVPVGSGLDPADYLDTIQTAEVAAVGASSSAATSAAASASSATSAAASAATANAAATSTAVVAVNAALAEIGAVAADLGNIDTCAGAVVAINGAAGAAATASAASLMAGSSATASAASETAAAVSATSAATSASAAAASATAAGAAETAASGSASTAATSATSAQTSATSAATSASAAAASATAAAASETAAATWAAQAQAASSGGAVKVSATDTVADFLQGKLVAGANVGLTRNNAGGAETLTVAVTGLGTAASQDAAAFASAAQGSKADTALQPAVIDTDGTLAADSDALVPSQKAVRCFVAGQLTGVAAIDAVARQDVQQIYLMGARMWGVTAGGMVNGVYDAFAADTLSGVSGTTGQTWDGSNKLYANPSSSAPVPQNTGTPYGNLTSQGGLAGAFDGNTSKASWGGTAFLGPSTDGKIGKDWGEGTTKIVTQAVIYGSSNLGFDGNGTPSITFALKGSNDGSNWTTIASVTQADPNTNTSVTIMAANPAAVSAYRYHIVELTGLAECGVAQLYLHQYTPPAMMTLVTPTAAATAPPTRIDAEILWKDVAGGAVLNTDLILSASTDGGATWTAGTLVNIGNTVSGFAVLSAYAPVSGSGTAVKIKLDTTTHSQQVAGYTLLWG